MSLSEFCIRRPVFTWAVVFIMVVIGIVGYQRLMVRNLPEISKPIVAIQTNYAGADAKLVETRITTPIENAVSGVSGIDYIRSLSSQGSSRVIIHFVPGYDISVAVNDIRDKISNIRSSLPTNVSAPSVFKADDRSEPAVILALTDKKLSAMALNDYITRYVQPKLEQIEGVNNASIWGRRAYTMRIMLNPLKMAAHSVAVNDITTALKNQNTYIPSGQVKGQLRYYPISTKANLYGAEQFRDLVIKSQNNYITRIGDVADVSIGPDTTDSSFRINSKSAIAIAIIPDSTANPIEISTLVKKALKTIQLNLPSGMKIQLLYDNTRFIHSSLNEVYRAIFEALCLVTLVIFLFLGSWRATLIPAITIPVCLLTTFGILYAFSYSINVITLLALVLAIGLVVDDAIVMLENIHRHIEMGVAPFKAAIIGSKEIAFAIIAMTLTLVAVYLPTGFTTGLTGVLFSQFAVTLAGSVLISGFVALTLSPMMCARVLNVERQKNRFSLWLEKSINRLMDYYEQLLRKVLNARIWVVIILIIFAGLGYLLYRSMPSELAPVEDQGYIIGHLESPPQASFIYLNHYAKMVENIYKHNPNIASYLMVVDTGFAYSVANLKSRSERDLTQQEISQKLKTQMDDIAGVDAFPVIPAPLNQRNSSNHSIEIKILSAGTLQHTIDVANNFVKTISTNPALHNVKTDTTIQSRLVNFDIKRNVAADLQVNINDITSSIATLYGGDSENQHFEYDGQEYDVLMQLPQKNLKQLSKLNEIYIRSQTGAMIPLSSLVSINSNIGAEEFPHYNRLRVATVSAELTPGYSMGKVVSYLEYAAKNDLPSGVQYAFGGSVKQYIETSDKMAGIFLLSLLFIYLVLAAQFESFIAPLVVLFSVPLSMLGGLLLLKITGHSLNIFSEIGMVTLIGLISKHGILIVEFANKQIEQGKDLTSAVIEASKLRLRPILMTTSAMVLGAVPLAFASGAGSESRQPVGWVIIGGMLLGTFFSLFVVPVAYTYLYRLKPRLKTNQFD